MNKTRTCFVISPIGPDGSEIRGRANDFLELLIEPALQKFNFTTIRADKIQLPTAITGDIVRLVQESDLCVIDLTDTNPNVFYECGRRHETGKPFIQLIDKRSLDKLPFDVAGIRTISYDLSTPRSTHDSILELQAFIQAIVDSGFSSGGTGESLSSIAQGIERLERKLNLIIQNNSSGTSTQIPTSGASLTEMLVTPMTAYQRAIEEGNVHKAFAAAQRFGPKKDISDYATMITLLCAIGYEPAYIVVNSMVEDLLDVVDRDEKQDEALTTFISGIRKFFENLDRIPEAIKALETVAEKISRADMESAELLANIYNQIGMLHWTDRNVDGCIESTMRAIQLFSGEAAYFYNLALGYEAKNDDDKLIPILRRLKDFGDEDEDHVSIIKRHGI